jgi:hypothetical protein
LRDFRFYPLRVSKAAMLPSPPESKPQFHSFLPGYEEPVALVDFLHTHAKNPD